jgi:hypothetical protein
MKVNIRFATYSVEAEIFGTPTGKAVYRELPLKNNVITWGHEIYFGVQSMVALEEGARAEVSVGDLAYWPNMPAFCIFFGPTPVSTGDQPVAASPVNVFGRLLHIDPDKLAGVREGENVVIEASP